MNPVKPLVYIRSFVTAAIGIGICFGLPACSFSSAEKNVTSPAGQVILSEATSSIETVIADAKKGGMANDLAAFNAGVSGAAQGLRTAEGLPVDPDAAAIAKAASVASGVSAVSNVLTPTVPTIITTAEADAKSKGADITVSQITEAVALGLDASAAYKSGSATPATGEAP